jgi:hypothetical protein
MQHTLHNGEADMTTQHTPAPWTVSDNAIYGSSGLIKPLIAYLDDRFVDEEAANNARLIAAAPDLLAALIELSNYVFDEYTASHPLCQRAAEARELIKRVKGEAK